MGALIRVRSRTLAALRRFAVLLSALLVAACGDNQMAFFSGDQAGQSVSVIREQAWLGGPWQTTLIVAAVPQCQRRYPLDGLATGELRIDVYRPGEGNFILSTDGRWFVTELQDCAFQAYQQPPPAPGELVGSFQMQNHELRYHARASTRAAAGQIPALPGTVR